MKKDLGAVQAVFPMPVLMVAAYDENGKVDVMNAAWGMSCSGDRLALFLNPAHKTTQSILKKKAFTVILADRAHMEEADYFGLASGNQMEDKFERTGFHAVKSRFVDAPVVEEFPVVMECELAEVVHPESFHCIVGRIVNTAAEERVLGEDGKVDTDKLDGLYFDMFRRCYCVPGEKAGPAWSIGRSLLEK